MALSIGGPTSQRTTIRPMLYDREKIRQLRGKLGISINELARRSGISGPSMHAIETGKTKNIRAQTLLNIANALGVPMREIVKPVKGQKAAGGGTTELIAVYEELDAKNKAAILAAAIALAAQQKKSP